MTIADQQPPRIVGGVDFLRATGLIARGYSKLTLQPTDITGGITDILEGVAALGFNLPRDGVFIADAVGASRG